jgi:hypothetical protein
MQFFATLDKLDKEQNQEQATNIQGMEIFDVLTAIDGIRCRQPRVRSFGPRVFGALETLVDTSCAFLGPVSVDWFTLESQLVRRYVRMVKP